MIKNIKSYYKKMFQILDIVYNYEEFVNEWFNDLF